ncbi:hypothetical protein QR680_002047 [Steinernema hermaphroditum]|uniref:Uncharacterized protein n=1 Tax=Steinernema hermaphroditum TaxID=289476 RepID=A0AA39LHD9_9BILA|nr:hypothetical protein QR680_002047 [Steinernema hermaphroditum]
MLAPIVTKDMKLFPSRPLPPYVKNSNVRARAQSLDEIGGPSQTKPFRQRNAQSVGHLPGVAKSPPKRSSAPRTPLDSIKEGVELGASSSGCTKSTSTLNDASDSRSVKSTGSAQRSVRLLISRTHPSVISAHCVHFLKIFTTALIRLNIFKNL